MQVVRNYFASTRRLIHSKQIDSPESELHIGYIMPNTGGEHVELRTKKLRLNTDLKLRTAEVKRLDLYSIEECKRMAEYYLYENLTKEVLDHIHHRANFGTLAFEVCDWWTRFKSKYFIKKILIKIRSGKKATEFVSSLIARHRMHLMTTGIKKYTEFILCGPHQTRVFESMMGFRYSDQISMLSTPFGPLHLLGSFGEVDIFIDPTFKSDYLIIGHLPSTEAGGTLIVHTECTHTTTEDFVAAKMMVGFIDFERATEYHAVAIDASQLRYF